MRQVNTRMLAVIGCLLAINAGLFIFNNLPLITMRENALQVMARVIRENGQRARHRVISSEIMRARLQARAIMRNSRIADGCRIELVKPAKPHVMPSTNVAQVRQLDRLNRLNVAVTVPPIPRVPAIRVDNILFPAAPAPPSSCDCGPKGKLQRVVFQDRML